MNFATVLRYVNMGHNDGWDERFSIPYFWKLMADKYQIGMNYIFTDYGFEEICEKCSGLIIPGSSTNINPLYWGGEGFTEKQAHDEYPLDAKLIEHFIKNDKPVLGICGGLQAINVYLGGTLKTVDAKIHGSSESKSHMININENSFVFDVFKSSRASVNTYHYWAIDRLAPGLKIVAESDDGVIEAVEWKEKRIFATQWHPERSFAEGDPNENKFFENFINLCK